MVSASRFAPRSSPDPGFRPPPGPPKTIPRKLIGLGKFLLGIDHVGRNIPLFPDDTLLVSFPRSGNTWLRFLIAGLAFPDRPPSFTRIEQTIPDSIVLTRRQLARIPRPRIIKSHEYFDPRYPRVIYITRDPRDVLLSYYNFYRKQRYIGDGYPMDRWVEHFLSGDLHPFGSWGGHVGSWLGGCTGSSNFLLTRYEDFLTDTAKELTRIAGFLGVEASAERLALVIESGSAETMRSLEKRETSGWGSSGKWRNDIPFVGPAAAGRWRKELDPALAARIESAWWPLMKALGYEIVSLPESQPGPSLTPAQLAWLTTSRVGPGSDLP